MTTRTSRQHITKLTPEQRATFPEWEAKWIAHGHRTGPLTPDEWDRVITGIRDCYRFADLAQPTIILTSSPLAAVVAVHVARRVRASGVWAGVGAGVGDGVRDGVWAGVGAYPPELRRPITDGLRDASAAIFREWHGGNLWCSWHAWASWFRDVGGLTLSGDLWERFAADEARAAAGPSWWYADFCSVSDLPTRLDVENRGGRWEMHREDGPAIEWADGWGLSFWRGTAVPADLLTDGWSVERIFAEPNAEIRRCAVEVMADRDGWAGIIAAAGWKQVGASVPDPGNPGQELSLWHVPADRGGTTRGKDGIGLYGQPVRLLRCTNATVERDGTRHEFALTVPDHITDPVAASAWTFDLTKKQYAALCRAS